MRINFETNKFSHLSDKEGITVDKTGDGSNLVLFSFGYLDPTYISFSDARRIANALNDAADKVEKDSVENYRNAPVGTRLKHKTTGTEVFHLIDGWYFYSTYSSKINKVDGFHLDNYLNSKVYDKVA